MPNQRTVPGRFASPDDEIDYYQLMAQLNQPAGSSAVPNARQNTPQRYAQAPGPVMAAAETQPAMPYTGSREWWQREIERAGEHPPGSAFWPNKRPDSFAERFFCAMDPAGCFWNSNVDHSADTLGMPPINKPEAAGPLCNCTCRAGNPEDIRSYRFARATARKCQDAAQIACKRAGNYCTTGGGNTHHSVALCSDGRRYAGSGEGI